MAGVEEVLTVQPETSKFEKVLREAAARIEDSAKRLVKATGAEKFAPVKAEGGGKSGVAMGVAAGIAAGGTIALLKTIADAIMDFPMVVSIMKLFKLIIMLLLMPLIPILKPAVQALAKIASGLGSLGSGAGGSGMGASSWIGALIGGIFGSVGGPLGVAIGAALGALIGNVTVIVAKKIGLWADAILAFFGIDMNKVRVAVVTFFYVTLPNFFTKTIPNWISNSILFLGNLGSKIWTVIKAMFNPGTISWTAVWEFLKGIVTGKKTESTTTTTPTNTGGVSGMNSLANMLTGGAWNFAMNQRQSGGSSVVNNLNISNPIVSSDADIRKLVKEMEQQLYRMQRRSNSYV